MATMKGLLVDVGAGKQDEGALPRVIRGNRLRGQSLVQVGESCNI